MRSIVARILLVSGTTSPCAVIFSNLIIFGGEVTRSVVKADQFDGSQEQRCLKISLDECLALILETSVSIPHLG